MHTLILITPVLALCGYVLHLSRQSAKELRKVLAELRNEEPHWVEHGDGVIEIWSAES